MVTRKSNTRALPVKTRVLLSYLAILVTPVAVATSLALQWITSSEIARIRRTLEDVSERIALSIETELRELESYVILTADSRMMTKLLYMPGDRLLLERFDNLTMLSDYLHQLTAYAATKEISSNLHVVLNTKDVVLTSGPQIGTVRFLANRILGHEDVDYQWFETLLAERHMASIIYPVHSALRPDVFSMLFVLSWPRHGSMPVLGTFVFEVDVASLLTVANHGTARDGITVVLSYQPAVGEKPLVVTPGPAEDPSWLVLVDSADETSFLDTGHALYTRDAADSRHSPYIS